MFELLSLVFGGLLRLAPEVLKLFNARHEREHEEKMTRIQLEIDKARAQQQIDLAHAQAAIAADAADMQALVEATRAQAVPSGIRWIDALSASVRPILTYWWCLVLYSTAKGITVWVAIQASMPLRDLAPLLVGEFDRLVIGSIFSFWFVDRALRRGAKLPG